MESKFNFAKKIPVPSAEDRYAAVLAGVMLAACHRNLSRFSDALRRCPPTTIPAAFPRLSCVPVAKHRVMFCKEILWWRAHERVLDDEIMECVLQQAARLLAGHDAWSEFTEAVKATYPR